jgi:hypothetical protein
MTLDLEKEAKTAVGQIMYHHNLRTLTTAQAEVIMLCLLRSVAKRARREVVAEVVECVEWYSIGAARSKPGFVAKYGTGNLLVAIRALAEKEEK